MIARLAVTVLACVSSACVLRPTPGDETVQREIDRVVCVYELDYTEEPLTTEQLACVYDVTVEWMRLRELRDECTTTQDREIGCYRPRTREIFITHVLTRYWELVVLRHEVLHHLLECIGRGDPGHLHPAFGSSTDNDPPWSLARMAPGVEECRDAVTTGGDS